MFELNVDKRAYDDKLSDFDGSNPDQELASPNSTSRIPAGSIYGTTHAGGLIGAAALGAGPQDVGIRPPPAVTNPSYSSLHHEKLVKKGAATLCPWAPITAHHRPGRELSLRQLRDIMNSVYASKASYDLKCQENKEATETMEQHLYGFLGKRYGLKSVIQEWASAIFKAIEKYSLSKTDVAMFGKILQNSLAESFPSVQDQLSQTAHQLLRSQLEERHHLRPKSEIEALWRARSRCGVPLVECEEVVRYMYNDADSDELMLRLHVASQNPTAEPQMDPLSPDSIRMKDMLQVLLSFQMSLTEAFLSDFVQIFRQVDQSGDGILNYTGLEELVRRVGYVEQAEEGTDAGTLLMEAKATTYSSLRKFKGGATFSQCVDLFTGLISARWGAISPS